MPGARSALRVDQHRMSSTLSMGALIQRTVYKLPFLLFQCLFVFSRGGLGVGEKPTRGELVRSTHRAPSPFINGATGKGNRTARRVERPTEADSDTKRVRFGVLLQTTDDRRLPGH